MGPASTRSGPNLVTITRDHHKIWKWWLDSVNVHIVRLCNSVEVCNYVLFDTRVTSHLHNNLFSFRQINAPFNKNVHNYAYIKYIFLLLYINVSSILYFNLPLNIVQIKNVLKFQIVKISCLPWQDCLVHRQYCVIDGWLAPRLPTDNQLLTTLSPCSCQPPRNEGDRGPLHDGRVPPRGEWLDPHGRQRGEAGVWEERAQAAASDRAISALLQDCRHNIAARGKQCRASQVCRWRGCARPELFKLDHSLHPGDTSGCLFYTKGQSAYVHSVGIITSSWNGLRVFCCSLTTCCRAQATSMCNYWLFFWWFCLFCWRDVIIFHTKC